MKVKKRKLMLVLLLIFGIGTGTTVQADAGHTETLTIEKYGLTAGATGFEASQTINTGQYINHLPVYDNTGKELKPLANISYQVQEVVVTGSAAIDWKDPTTYRAIDGVQTITTDNKGEASLVLTDGFYIVSEEANPSAGLSAPAAPLLIALPSWDETTATWSNHTYIYPKSSVDRPQPVPPPDPGPSNPVPVPGSHEQDILPVTGDKVTAFSILVLFIAAFVGLMIRQHNRSLGEEN